MVVTLKTQLSQYFFFSELQSKYVASEYLMFNFIFYFMPDKIQSNWLRLNLEALVMLPPCINTILDSLTCFLFST